MIPTYTKYKLLNLRSGNMKLVIDTL